MSELKPTNPCPECHESPRTFTRTRRDLLKGVGGAVIAAAAGSLPLFAVARSVPASAAPAPGAAGGAAETLVSQFYNTLTEDQKKAVCFGWSDPKRLMIANNWHIVPQTVGGFFTPDQQEQVMGIFKSAHSEEWVAKRLQQMKDDSGPEGIKNYNVAIFGQPGTNQFEWVMTGRHLTLRVDGDSEPGVAFGGPVFYGHAAQGFNEKPDHPGNVYWYQAQRANEVFGALSGKQREKALVMDAVPIETPSTLIPHAKGERPGIPVADMSRDQRELVSKVLGDLLAPMRKSDVLEARHYLDANGGVSSLNMAFYKQEDIGGDGVWDVWRLEGPSMVWYFRGSPHVHTWVYLSEKPLATAPPGPSA
jgi:hypothetical protein